MVNEETLNQVPEDVRLYLRTLRRRILELEQPYSQQGIAELEAANRKLQVELDELRALFRLQQEQIRQLQQQLADTTAQLNTNSSNSSLPPIRQPPTGPQAGRQGPHRPHDRRPARPPAPPAAPPAPRAGHPHPGLPPRRL